MTCECRSCVRGRAFAAAKASRDTDALIQLCREALDDLASAEADLNYDRAILDGSWPDGRRILERALAKYSEEKP